MSKLHGKKILLSCATIEKVFPSIPNPPSNQNQNFLDRMPMIERFHLEKTVLMKIMRQDWENFINNNHHCELCWKPIDNQRSLLGMGRILLKWLQSLLKQAAAFWTNSSLKQPSETAPIQLITRIYPQGDEGIISSREIPLCNGGRYSSHLQQLPPLVPDTKP